MLPFFTAIQAAIALRGTKATPRYPTAKARQLAEHAKALQAARREAESLHHNLVHSDAWAGVLHTEGSET